MSGEAELAKANGRTGLLIHGGALGTTPMGQFLRSTNGCFRMDDRDIKAFIDAIRANRIELPLPLIVIEGSPTMQSSLFGGLDESYNAGDPPP